MHPHRGSALAIVLLTACASGDDPRPRDPAPTAPSTPPCEAQTWYADADGDGWGDDTQPTTTCDDPEPGFVGVAGDCDDGDAGVHPGALDSPLDTIDQDCAGGPASEPDCADTAAVWSDGDWLFEGPAPLRR